MTETITLSERAMLVSLHTGQWSPFVTDREVSNDTNERYQAETNAGRYTKVLAAPVFMKPITAQIRLARMKHDLLTLPWDKGAEILNATAWDEYTTTMRLARKQVEAAAAEFAADFPSDMMLKDAEKRLGKMFNRDDYPTADEVRAKFYVDVEVKPLGEARDFRTKLSDVVVKGIIKDIEKRHRDRLETAMHDVFERIKAVVTPMTKLREYDPTTGKGDFRPSRVFNVRELVGILPILNITGDKRIEQLQQQLSEDLAATPPQVLKADDKIRQRTADKADRILKRVEAYLA